MPASPTMSRAFSRINPRRVLAMLRHHPDPFSPEGRAHERQRRVKLTAGMSMLSKAVSISTQLITVPITLHYLGPERYGMWMVLSTFTSMLAFADLGICNGMINAVSAANGRDDIAGIRRAISSGTVAMITVVAILLSALYIAYPFVRWDHFYNVHTPLARAEASPAMLVFGTCVALAIPANIFPRLQLALQRGFLATAWQCAGNAMALPAVFLAVWLHASLPVLVGVFVGLPMSANLLNTTLFLYREPAYRPDLRLVDRRSVFEVLHKGLKFVAIQLGNAVTAASVPMIIAQVAGADQVAQYSLPERLLALTVMLVSMYVQPLWPAYREALTRGDIGWARETYRRTTLGIALVSATVLLVLGLSMNVILRHWVGGAVHPAPMLILGLGLYKLAEALFWSNAMLLNAMDELVSQSIMALTCAGAFVAAAVLAGRYLGMPAIPWCGLLILGLVQITPGTVIIMRRLYREQGA